MIRVRVLLFAALRDLLGEGDLTLSISNGGTLTQLAESLFPDPEVRRRILRGITCAINYEEAPWDAPLQSGDEVAFLPPMSGG